MAPGAAGKPHAARPTRVENMTDILETIQQLQEQSDLRVKDYDKLKAALEETQRERDLVKQNLAETQALASRQREVKNKLWCGC